MSENEENKKVFFSFLFLGGDKTADMNERDNRICNKKKLLFSIKVKIKKNAVK